LQGGICSTHDIVAKVASQRGFGRSLCFAHLLGEDLVVLPCGLCFVGTWSVALHHRLARRGLGRPASCALLGGDLVDCSTSQTCSAWIWSSCLAGFARRGPGQSRRLTDLLGEPGLEQRSRAYFGYPVPMYSTQLLNRPRAGECQSEDSMDSSMLHDGTERLILVNTRTLRKAAEHLTCLVPIHRAICLTLMCLDPLASHHIAAWETWH
jgi:hypothetical protein